ncbi:MAG: hypothetical protein RL757_1245 [Bacteroidota bacterium]|jgi:aminopeptidase N
MKKNLWLLVGTILALSPYSCTPSKKIQPVKTVESPAVVKAEPPVEAPMPVSTLPIGDAAMAYPDTLPIYRATAKQETDLIHSVIDVRFDWKKRHCIGKIVITAKPYFYETDILELDAKGMDIKSVEDADRRSPLKYEYKNDKLVISLGRIYTRNDQYRVAIEYVGKPDEAYTGGGSEAISSDKGLFFINPDGTDANKPIQIWTQGETESNSHWFPTIDKPNQRMTTDINITVEDKYKTLSNGLLVGSKNNGNGTRTDAWKMDKPHAPYLVMMAVGNFAVVTEKWRGKDLMYYVEPKYEKNAKQIFKNTPELLSFYSDKLGVEYPWQKYAQVIVRDYVSGAMENTTAVIFGEYLNGTERETIDNEYNETVVAHEMFHHWFGDLVTCESWSNLTVNESFANYSESLWFANKYGDDFGEHHLYEDMLGYFDEAQTRTHNLVHFAYNSREEMFDRHSYNKGGCILHQLRKYVGDEAFFAALKKYLNQHAYSTGEAHELRLAFESVTGEDLNWFFNQWYFKAGHPKIEINYEYDPANKKMTVSIEQNQQPTDEIPAVFELPMAVDIYADGKKERKMIRMNRRKQAFVFDCPTKPDLVNVDAEKMLVAEKIDNHSDDEWAFMYKNAPKYLDRREALEVLMSKKTPVAKAILKSALSDKFWGIRELAVKGIGSKEDPEVLPKIMEMAEKDNRSQVRIAAIQKLEVSKNVAYAPVLKNIANTDFAYTVVAAAMKAVNKLAPTEVIDLAKQYENAENGDLLSAVGNIFASTADLEKLKFFEKNMPLIEGPAAIDFTESYAVALLKVAAAKPDFDIVEKMMALKSVGINPNATLYRRYAATKALVTMRKLQGAKASPKLSEMLQEIKQKETNEQLKAVYDSIISKVP